MWLDVTVCLRSHRPKTHSSASPCSPSRSSSPHFTPPAPPIVPEQLILGGLVVDDFVDAHCDEQNEYTVAFADIELVFLAFFCFELLVRVYASGLSCAPNHQR